jgi:hypothetical protein
MFGLSLTGSLSLFVLAAFAPALARACWSLLKPARALNLRRVGVLEMVYSFIFLVFISVGLGHR